MKPFLENAAKGYDGKFLNAQTTEYEVFFPMNAAHSEKFLSITITVTI